jgi:hypothetical protein
LVIGDLPLSFRQSVEQCQSSGRASLDCKTLLVEPLDILRGVVGRNLRYDKRLIAAAQIRDKARRYPAETGDLVFLPFFEV